MDASQFSYGSDFGSDGDELLAQCLDEVESLHLQQLPGQAGIHDHEAHVSQPRSPPLAIAVTPSAGLEEHPPPGKDLTSVHEAAQQDEPRQLPPGPSPLQRFRTSPRKPLSVTDLVSPSWCELQYEFSLSRHGRVRPTPAMRRGTSVHRELEEQVHQTVPIDVQTREDSWGLKLWNVIQGLRTLRVTGMTRELEVFGTVDGLVITGVIDELSFNCTDPTLEATLGGTDGHNIDANQTTLQDFFGPQRSIRQAGVSLSEAMATSAQKVTKRDQRKVYLTDVKTRNHPSLPNAVSMRPTQMQLMLYRRLLSLLVDNQVSAETIFNRFRLDSSKSFSDSLIDQLSALDLNLRSHADEGTVDPVESEDDAIGELVEHNNLSKLWSLMVQEYQLTLPRGPDSLSHVLQAEYRASSDGHVIGTRTFAFDLKRIEDYISSELDWWRGRRPPRGVDIEEAFKCRICEFAEDCSWRINKIEEATQRARESKQPKK